MRHEVSRHLFEYWNRQRKTAAAPAREQVRPADIRTILKHVFILEQSQAENMQFRLAGTDVCGVFCRELKSMPFHKLWLAEKQGSIRVLERNIRENVKPVMLSLEAENPNGKPVEFEMVILPLDDGNGRIDRFIGAMSPQKAPYWLHSDPVGPLTTTGLRVLNKVEEVRKASALRTSGKTAQISPNVIPAEHSFINNARRVGHLTIIDGGLID